MYLHKNEPANTLRASLRVADLQVAHETKTISLDIMLILTRRIGESLRIGDHVQVTVLGVKGNQVRIGVDAPKDISVHREEVYERIKREREVGSGIAKG